MNCYCIVGVLLLVVLLFIAASPAMLSSRISRDEERMRKHE